MTLDRISLKDGLGQTLMILENHNSRNWGKAVQNANTTYANYTAPDVYPVTGSSGSSQNTTVLDCGIVVNIADLGVTLPTNGSLVFAVNSKTSAININKGFSPGASPFPSSTHPGIVTAAFCDGRVRTLNDNMDYATYIKLISSGGTRRGQPPMNDNY